MQTIRLDASPENGTEIDVRDILRVVGQDAITAWWSVTGVERFNETVDAHGDRAEELDDLYASGERVPGPTFKAIADAVIQIIWGRFNAFRSKDEATRGSRSLWWTAAVTKFQPTRSR